MGRCMIAFAAVLVLAACMTGGPAITHEITYTAKGTRSEARHGHLFVDGREVPWVFSRVACEPSSYVLRFRSHLWGDDGYWPEVPVYTPPDGGAPLLPDSLDKGYALSFRRPAGTPADWIWVQWGKNQGAFVAPDRIEDLLREEKIPDPAPKLPGMRRRLE